MSKLKNTATIYTGNITFAAMLQRLHIRNYAIIDELKIDFQPGLNIITGETGAGKSILMGALGLVLGNRADTTVLFEPLEKCFVEAVFNVSGHNQVKKVLAENELDEDDTLILRREIAANGKSRSFVNDTPVTLQLLKMVASQLVDLHRQFDTLTLGDAGFQRAVIDALAGQLKEVDAYNKHFNEYQAALKKLHKLQEQQLQVGKEKDYHQFLHNELAELNLEPNELEELEQELKLLGSAEQIKTTLATASYTLHEGEPSLLQQVKWLAQQLQPFGDAHTSLNELADRLQSAYIELQDIAGEIERINDHLQLDGERLHEVTERLGEGYRLLKKHGVNTTTELLEISAQLGEKLSGIENLGEEIALAEKESIQLASICFDLASKISANRQKVSPGIEKTTCTLLAQMGMPNARLKVQVKPNGTGKAALGEFGIDEISFLFDGNKSERFEPLEKVASGGELSRLMLAIKSQVARSIQLPALIFDEIDTGISGEAARQVGLLLLQLAGEHQVISITHQPQIAARANAHFFVYKQESGGAIKTRMRLLDQAEKADVIARMLSGEVITEAARKIAIEMIGNHE